MTGVEGTVFVVDDDPSVRGGLGRLFKSVGLAVEVFASAREFWGGLRRRGLRAWFSASACRS